MNIITEKNSVSSNSFWEEVPDKKIRKESFILFLEGKLAVDDQKYLPQWKILLYTLIEVNTKKDLMEHFLTPPFAKYFFDKILTIAVKSILACEKFVSKEFNQVLDSILVQTLLLWSKNLRNYPSALWNIVSDEILQLKNPYYKIGKSILDLESPLETSVEHFTWLQTLKKGDTVDCVKTVDYQRRFSLKVWSYAEIISVNEKSIMVCFIKDSEKSQEISKTASCHEIAPYKTKCDDFDWRMSLQAGDVVDAAFYDWREKSYHATVIETRENPQGEKEVLVGYRSYSEDGDETDLKGRKCFGCLEKYDKWFNVTSPSIVKKNFMTNSSTFDKDGDSLIDSLDMIFKPSSPEKTVYAVYQENRCHSITFVNIINQFGEQGGFDNISQVLLDKNNSLSIENNKRVCQNLSKLDNALHRAFVREYAAKLQDFWAPEIEGVWRDRYIDILDKLLKRAYSSYRLSEIVESYKPPKPVKEIKGPELDRMNKIELIEYLEQNGFPQEYLEDSEKRNKLFHVEVIQRKLTMEQIARLWVAIKPNNKERIDTMCQDIFMVFYNYSNPHRGFFISLVDHLFETNPEDLAERSVELIMIIFDNATTIPDGYYQKFYNFLQRSIHSSLNRFSYRLIVYLNKWFARLSNDFLSADEILQILYKYTDNVAQHILALPSLNLIEAFSEYQPKADKNFSQGTYVEHLCQEKNLIELTLQDFRFSKQQLAEKTVGQTVTEKFLESLLPNKMYYTSSYVSGMINTVMFLHQRSPDNRSKLDILQELWDITVKNCLIPEEKEPLLRKIRGIIASKEGSCMKEEDLKSLMKELDHIQSPSDLTYEAYEYYTNLFVTLHEKLGNIYDVMFVGSGTDLTSHYGYYRYDKFLCDSYLSRDQCFEIKVRVPVEKLEGFDQIWKFILFSEDKYVLERATDFHAMIYSNLDNEFRNKGESLWQGFLTTVKKYLTEILENKESVPTELLAKRLSRCIKSVIRLLWRTEESIPRDFQSHWKLNHRGNISVGFYDMEKEERVQMSSEQTIRDLLVEYEKKKGVKKDYQVVYTNKRYLPLYEAGVESGLVQIEEKKPKESVLGYLQADGEKNLDPRAKVIFTKWFEEFSANGKMSPDQFGMFLQSIGRETTVNSSLIKNTFESYDKDRDGLLTVENFLSYYQVSSRSYPYGNPFEVWNDIATRGEMYGSKLYKFDEFGQVKEVVEPKPEISPSLRSQVSLDKEFSELLYSLLKFEDKNERAYWLLERLPTNLKVFSDIVTLRGVRDADESAKRDWEQAFTSKSPTAFLYTLDIIDYLFMSNMEDNNPDDTRESISGGLDIWLQNPELLKYKETWCQDFIKLGGSKHLGEAMETVKKHPNFEKAYRVQERMEKSMQQVFIFFCSYTEDPKAKTSTL